MGTTCDISIERVVLIGPSGAGKSQLAQRLADVLGFTPLDLDSIIVSRIGMPIAEFFERFGEPAFRAIEREVVSGAVATPRAVIATGGGAVLAPENWAAWRPHAVVLGLTATPEMLVERVARQVASDGVDADRPLLAGDAIGRIQDLLRARSALYAQADATIDTTDLSLDDVHDRAIALIREIDNSQRVPVQSLLTSSGRSDIFVHHGARRVVGTLIRQRWPNAKRCWVISDAHVANTWLVPIQEILQSAGLRAESLIVDAGEPSKSLATVQHLVEQMTAHGVTRRDVVVALGGGVVGDLAGFVASICLRGLPLVQVPTSLLAMVDSSVGGKTGVNLPAGKNLAGAFYQPGIVVIDPEFLESLPVEEYRSGMAEVIKHGFIQPSTPMGSTTLQQTLRAIPLQPMPSEHVADVLAQNVATKLSVVQADERESGLRMILNFGHTAGHAIEADGYRFRHGEAVALGMLVACRIAQRMGRITGSDVQQLESTLARSGLPTRYDGTLDAVLTGMSHDKKNVDGALHWILPQIGGGVEIVTGVPLDFVRDALAEIGAFDPQDGLR